MAADSSRNTGSRWTTPSNPAQMPTIASAPTSSATSRVLRCVWLTNAAGVRKVGSMLMAERLCTRTSTVIRSPGPSRSGATDTLAGTARWASGSRLPCSSTLAGVALPAGNR